MSPQIFYGQRKYKPSGRENTTGRYTGMGMSDKARIDAAREYKEEMMEIRKLREQGLNKRKWLEIFKKNLEVAVCGGRLCN